MDNQNMDDPKRQEPEIPPPPMTEPQRSLPEIPTSIAGKDSPTTGEN